MTVPEPLPLCDVSELFRRSWDAFRVKLWRLLAVGGLGGAASLVGSMLPLAAAALYWVLTGTFSLAGWLLALAVSLSAVLWLVSWTQAAMMEVALDDAGALDALRSFRVSWPKVAAFSWVCILFFALVCGGFFLLLLPGVFVGVALALCPFVCVAEGLGGFAALERAWGLARGRWVGVALRLFLIGLMTSVASAVPWLGILLSMFAAPFALVLTAELYRDAARTAPPVEASRGAGRWAFAVCALGLLLAGAAGARGVSAFVDAWPQLQAQARGLMEHPLDAQKLQELQAVLEGGLTPENLEKAQALIEQAQNPTSAALAVSTTSVAVLPAPPPAAPRR